MRKIYEAKAPKPTQAAIPRFYFGKKPSDTGVTSPKNSHESNLKELVLAETTRQMNERRKASLLTASDLERLKNLLLKRSAMFESEPWVI